MGNIADNTVYEVESPTRVQRGEIIRNLIGTEHNPDPPMPNFADLLNQDGLPDIVHYYFRCSACNLLFELFVDTYHGSGGEWRPVEDESQT